MTVFVWVSIPLDASINKTQKSSAGNTLTTSKPKSACPGVSNKLNLNSELCDLQDMRHGCGLQEIRHGCPELSTAPGRCFPYKFRPYNGYHAKEHKTLHRILKNPFKAKKVSGGLKSDSGHFFQCKKKSLAKVIRDQLKS